MTDKLEEDGALKVEDIAVVDFLRGLISIFSEEDCDQYPEINQMKELLFKEAFDGGTEFSKLYNNIFKKMWHTDKEKCNQYLAKREEVKRLYDLEKERDDVGISLW